MKPMTRTVFGAGKKIPLSKDYRFVSTRTVHYTNPMTQLGETRVTSLGSATRTLQKPVSGFYFIPKGRNRNQTCRCGSNKKLKHCCWGKLRSVNYERDAPSTESFLGLP